MKIINHSEKLMAFYLQHNQLSRYDEMSWFRIAQ